MVRVHHNHEVILEIRGPSPSQSRGHIRDTWSVRVHHNHEVILEIRGPSPSQSQGDIRMCTQCCMETTTGPLLSGILSANRHERTLNLPMSPNLPNTSTMRR